MMQGRSKRPFFLIAGAGGRIGLLVMACANEPTLYLLGFGLFSVTDAFLIPALTGVAGCTLWEWPGRSGCGACWLSADLRSSCDTARLRAPATPEVSGGL
jgi:hypothetical protein